MSGGSYNYGYQNIDHLADEIRINNNRLRAAFMEHLKLVAKACHAIEWVDSGDMGPGEENAAIRAVLSVKFDPEMCAKAAAFDEISKWFDGKKEC